ncbi:hypothetical protein SAMN05661091_4082 [Paenibacillus uliginis N3/975]|uniref:Phage ABA sandwich domain-containing protein n=1 Tax=Paenibacillus uliginis N3/975 TaxID=1313296 RepID=A0A1X7HK61_9BACL|nr:hypothetical protein [Paenibacillus uliginis]SMF88049.1 hypothetical protein SAMN05661091_4082 [Paenibacillus uliginis N3/975]
MTREEILAMKPWQIDRHVHEILFDGEDLSEFEYKGNGSYVKVTDTSVIWRDVPNYSTNLSAAWEVFEKFGYHAFIETNHGGGYIASVNCIAAFAITAPEAICKAALIAVLDPINLPGDF